LIATNLFPGHPADFIERVQSGMALVLFKREEVALTLGVIDVEAHETIAIGQRYGASSASRDLRRGWSVS
jgi:hypothetical protein